MLANAFPADDAPARRDSGKRAKAPKQPSQPTKRKGAADQAAPAAAEQAPKRARVNEGASGSGSAAAAPSAAAAAGGACGGLTVGQRSIVDAGIRALLHSGSSNFYPVSELLAEVSGKGFAFSLPQLLTYLQFCSKQYDSPGAPAGLPQVRISFLILNWRALCCVEQDAALRCYCTSRLRNTSSGYNEGLSTVLTSPVRPSCCSRFFKDSVQAIRSYTPKE